VHKAPLAIGILLTGALYLGDESRTPPRRRRI